MIKIIYQNYTSKEFKVKIQTHCKDLSALFVYSNRLGNKIQTQVKGLRYE